MCDKIGDGTLKYEIQFGVHSERVNEKMRLVLKLNIKNIVIKKDLIIIKKLNKLRTCDKIHIRRKNVYLKHGYQHRMESERKNPSVLK